MLLDKKYHQTFRLKLSTVSPVHVGTGEITPTSMLEELGDGLLGVADIDGFIAAELDGIKDIEELEKKIFSLTAKISEEGLSPGAFKILRKILGNKQVCPEFREQIHLDLPGGHRPYLPGSSIKGSIRTVFLVHLLDGQKLTPEYATLGNNPKDLKKQFDRVYGNILRNEFTGKRAQSDIGRLFHLPDIEFGGSTCELHKFVVANWTHKGWQSTDQELTAWLECLPAGLSSEMDFQFDKTLFELVKMYRPPGYFPYRDKDKILGQINPLFNMINSHTLELLKSEQAFLEGKFSGHPVVEKYHAHLETSVKEIKNAASDYCILRLGFGSGFRFMTGDWQEEGMDEPLDNRRGNAFQRLQWAVRRKNYGDLPFPKTLKILENGQPLGFVKLEKMN